MLAKMILCVFNLIGFIAFGLCVEQKLMLPINTCERNSTDYSTCLKDAIQEAWPRFIQGLPEFDFPILDPLLYDRHHAIYDSGEVHSEADVTDIITTGLADTRFLFAKTHFADGIFRIEVDSHVPKIVNTGNLKLVGSIGPFRLNSTGHFNITSTDVKVRWIITGDVVNDRWMVQRFRTIPIVRAMKIYVSGLLDDEQLQNLVYEFVNEYWPALYRAVGPKAIDTWDPWLVNIVNHLFFKVSFSKVFPKYNSEISEE